MKMTYKHVRPGRWERSGEFYQSIAEKGGKTFAVESLCPQAFQALRVGQKIQLHFGKAVCSDKDRYCKQTGRELALSRIEPLTFTVHRIIDDLSGDSAHRDALLVCGNIGMTLGQFVGGKVVKLLTVSA